MAQKSVQYYVYLILHSLPYPRCISLWWNEKDGNLKLFTKNYNFNFVLLVILFRNVILAYNYLFKSISNRYVLYETQKFIRNTSKPLRRSTYVRLLASIFLSYCFFHFLIWSTPLFLFYSFIAITIFILFYFLTYQSRPTMNIFIKCHALAIKYSSTVCKTLLFESIHNYIQLIICLLFMNVLQKTLWKNPKLKSDNIFYQVF